MERNINSSISLVSHIHGTTADFLTKELAAQGFDDFATSHGNILFQLSLNTQMTMGELSRQINRDKSTTTVLVRKLMKEGYVEEKTSAEDKRSKLITLTAKGMQYEKVTSNISKQLLDTFYKGFTEEEKLQFLGYLERIHENFNTEN